MAKLVRLYPCRMPAGAYGFELDGAADVASHLLAAAPDWPALEIVRRTGVVPHARSLVGSDRAEIALVAGDHLALERNPLRATFTTAQQLSSEALVHPYLAPAAAIASYWIGREAFHGGGFILDDGVWAVLGAKDSGKSSLLAGLALQGYGIHADDALILDGDVAYAGPRSIDLRQEPAEQLGVGESLGVVGDRERWRLPLGQVSSTSRLRGWVFLAWNDSLELTPLGAGDRLQRLLGHRMAKGLPPPDPGLILELSALPAFELRRPRSWAQLETVGSRLVELLAAR
jgi:hypothetical protein